MFYSFKEATQNQELSENNKADVALFQPLLSSTDLLSLVQCVIDIKSSKSLESIVVKGFYLLSCLTYLSKWLRDVTMLFLGLICIIMAHFLLSKNLSIDY